MRAIFKPDDPKKLIVRDADVNEVSLINYFIGLTQDGGSVTAETRYDLNDKPAGILFTAKDKEETEKEDPVYVKVNPSKILNDGTIVSFILDVEHENVVPYSIDAKLWENLKLRLENLGLVDVDIVTVNSEESEESKINVDPRITAMNPTGRPVDTIFEVPAEFVRYVDRDTNKTNVYSQIFTVILREM